MSEGSMNTQCPVRSAPRVFLLGYPGAMGGANTECWHTVKLWRRMGLDVTLIPTWGNDPAWEEKLAAIGCQTVHAKSDDLRNVPGLRAAIVVGMCNSHYTRVYPVLKNLGCKTVWVNCMTFMFDHERNAFRQHGPADAYVFQSDFQRKELEPQLAALGYRPGQGYTIHGAFDVEEFPFKPLAHEAGEEFVIGRLSRPDLDKWSSNHWRILDVVPFANRRALCMGWTQPLDRKLGRPPGWAECLPPQRIPVSEFLGRCHAMVGLNGGARENWPRVGLEAMASGVPLVCQNLWGWPEMIEHEVTGFLCEDDQDFAYWLGRLAREESLRRGIIHKARTAVEAMASPALIGADWQKLFDRLTNG
jgi:glycosyltransferase involved in cell wall biosynthesis